MDDFGNIAINNKVILIHQPKTSTDDSTGI